MESFIEDEKNPNDEEKTQISSSEKEKEYYYCTKHIKFPLKNVVRDVYDFFIEQNATNLKFNDIYLYLSSKYNVSSFNRKNLGELLGTTMFISFEKIKNLYEETNVSKPEENLDILKYFFLEKREEMVSILSVLGIETLSIILEKGLSALLPALNSIGEFCEGEKIFELKNKRKDKVLQKKSAKILTEFLRTMNDEEWFQLLQNADQAKAFLDEYIKEKKLEEERSSFKKQILSQLELVHRDNLSARVEFVFSASISEILGKHEISIVDEIKTVNKKIADELFVFKKDFLRILKDLEYSIPKEADEKFGSLLQMKSKNNVPNKLWKDWVAVLELRAEGATLEGAGSPLGVTRERVRQLENRYLDEFSSFFYNQKFNIQNYIKAFVENPMFVTNEDLSRLFPSNPKLFKYFLQSVSRNNLIFIDEIDKFSFSEDIDWYNELLSFSDNLPAQVIIDESEKYVIEAQSLMKQRNVLLSAKDCELILFQNYKKVGIFYSRKKIKLADRFKTIMKTYYPNPVNIYGDKFLSDFKKYYTKMYGDSELKSDHAITTILSRIGVLVSRGEYILSDRKFMSKDLADKIFEYLSGSENTIFLTNTIFHLFKEELCAQGIDNKYFMTSAFKQWYGDKFFFKRDYISKAKFTTNIYDEIVCFIKNQGRIVEYEEVTENFPAVTWNILNFAFSSDFVLNYRAKYIHIDNLHVEDEDVSFLKEEINDIVSDGKIHHTEDILSYIRLAKPELLEKYYIQDAFCLYSFLEHFFDAEFEFKRPFVARNGIKIENQYDRIKAFVYSQEEVSITSLLEFIYDNKLHMYSIVEFVDTLEDYCFKNEEMLIEIKRTGLNEFNVEQLEQTILREMGEKEFAFADELQHIFALPRDVQWTPWLIYSAVNKLGKDLKAIPSDTKFRVKGVQYARPLIVRKDIPAKDINELKKYLQNKLKLDEKSFCNYLSSKGLA